MSTQGSLVLDGASIEANQAGPSEDGWGGGVLVLDSLTMTNSSISDNDALGEGDGSGGYHGGALVGGDVTMTNSHIDRNHADEYFGGLIAADIDADVTVTMSNSTIDGNTAKGNSGVTADIIHMTDSSVSGNAGGFAGTVLARELTMVDSVMSDNAIGFPALVMAADVIIDGSRFEDNVSPDGNAHVVLGAWAGEGSLPSAISVVVDDSIIQGNAVGAFAIAGDRSDPAIVDVDVAVRDSTVVDNGNAPAEAGSAAGAFSGGDLIIERSVVARNTASAEGSSAGVEAEGELAVLESTVADNDAPTRAGAIGGTAVSVVGSTISGNNAADSGGRAGVVGSEEITAVSVGASTISGNEAQRAGVVGGVVHLAEATVSGNQGSAASAVAATTLWAVASAIEGAGPGPTCSVGGDSSSDGYNVVAGAGCGLDVVTDRVVPSLELGPLVDNGGPTSTRLPTGGSPLIGVIPLDHTQCTGLDQRGVSRPQGFGCESGAVEMGAPTFADVPLEHEFFVEIECLVALGVTEGYDDGTFRPTNEITRMALAAWVCRYEAAGFAAA